MSLSSTPYFRHSKVTHDSRWRSSARWKLRTRLVSATAVSALAWCVLVAWPASAQDLVYESRNPSFGGNPFNSSHLLGLAERQNQFDGRSNGIGRDPGAQLVRRLESRIASSVARQAADAILGIGDNPRDEGTIRFGGQIIEFQRGIESVSITIIDEEEGTSTEISVPLVSVE